MPTCSRAHRALSLSIILGAAPLGCGATAAPEPPMSASSAATRAPIAQHLHGQVKVFADALADVPLTAPQRVQIEQLAADAEARHAGARTARKDWTLAVAAQVQSGRIDRAALRPKIDAVAAAVMASQPADRAALERLHAILEPNQRTAFVDALEARMAQPMGGHRGMGGSKPWADELGLSEDQRAQIRAVLEQHFGVEGRGNEVDPRWFGRKERGAKLLNAFKQDRFVLDEIAPAENVGQRVAKSSDRFVGVAEAALPILTSEQRAAAAGKLRARAAEEPARPMIP